MRRTSGCGQDFCFAFFTPTDLTYAAKLSAPREKVPQKKARGRVPDMPAGRGGGIQHLRRRTGHGDRLPRGGPPGSAPPCGIFCVFRLVRGQTLLPAAFIPAEDPVNRSSFCFAFASFEALESCPRNRMDRPFTAADRRSANQRRK